MVTLLTVCVHLCVTYVQTHDIASVLFTTQQHNHCQLSLISTYCLHQYLPHHLTQCPSVHRGAYFNDSRTSSVRKLLPEGWGFLCPVHTPDGAPCGLLNHLAASCQVITHPAHESDEAEVCGQWELCVCMRPLFWLMRDISSCFILVHRIQSYCDPLSIRSKCQGCSSESHHDLKNIMPSLSKVITASLSKTSCPHCQKSSPPHFHPHVALNPPSGGKGCSGAAAGSPGCGGSYPGAPSPGPSHPTGAG